MLMDWSNECQVLPRDAVPWGCNFEQDTCKWTQSKYGNMAWTRHNGSTSASDTAPTVDHTTNTSKGYYMNMEASYPAVENGTAALISGFVKGYGNNTITRYCMSFAYYMKGSNSDKLQVKLKPQNESDSAAIWQRVGSQGPDWKHTEVQLVIMEDTQVLN